MIEIDFDAFHEHDFEEAGFSLYVMKNGLGDVLYVGISSQGIWSRWFGWNGHMHWDGNVSSGHSLIGQKIEDHFPDSMKWKIQLWTLEDCIVFCGDTLLGNRASPDIEYLEPLMIQKLSPALNVTYNLHPGKDTTPQSERERKREEDLDKWYRKIFG